MSQERARWPHRAAPSGRTQRSICAAASGGVRATRSSQTLAPRGAARPRAVRPRARAPPRRPQASASSAPARRRPRDARR